MFRIRNNHSISSKPQKAIPAPTSHYPNKKQSVNITKKNQINPTNKRSDANKTLQKQQMMKVHQKQTTGNNQTIRNPTKRESSRPKLGGVIKNTHNILQTPQIKNNIVGNTKIVFRTHQVHNIQQKKHNQYQSKKEEQLLIEKQQINKNLKKEEQERQRQKKMEEEEEKLIKFQEEQERLLQLRKRREEEEERVRIEEEEKERVRKQAEKERRRMEREKEREQEERRELQNQALMQRINRRRQQRSLQKNRVQQNRQRRKKQLEELQQRLNVNLSEQSTDNNLAILFSSDNLAHFQVSETLIDLQLQSLLKFGQNFAYDLSNPIHTQLQNKISELSGINQSYMMIRDDPINQRMSEGLNGYRIQIMNVIGDLLIRGNIISNMDAGNINLPGVKVTRGINKHKIDKLTEEVICNESESCPICLNEFRSRETGLQPKCGHTFHRECLESWLENTGNCPSCRYNIKYA